MAGLLVTLGTWAGLRRLVGASLVGRGAPKRALAMDAYPCLAALFLFTLPTARPILAGLAVACLGIGMGIADRVKRAVLDEPVVFADRAELLEVVRHPRLYLAFVGTGWMVLGATACVAAVAALVHFEPPLWYMSLGGAALRALAAAVIGRLLFVLPTWPPLLVRLGRAYAQMRPSREPVADAARLGLLATCIVHATLARVERPARQRAAQARRWPAIAPGSGPIVIVQGESFVDAGRLHPELAAFLPNFAALRRDAVRQGRLTVPCWGANTIRSELAVLAGLGPDEVGLDRFNPYERFARVPLPSLASVARAAGYRTICIHPYNADFYDRDKVMPALGFDEFIGLEGFADGARMGPYVGDAAVADRVAALVLAHGPRVLVFAITMENHGPWDAAHDAVEPTPLPADWQGLKDARAIGRWLTHLRSTDAMIPVIRDAIGSSGWLLFYGDHQPSLSGPFHAPGAADRRTDYALWGAGRPGGGVADRAAEELAGDLLAAIGASQG